MSISKKRVLITALLLWVAWVVWAGVVHQYNVMHDVPKETPAVQPSGVTEQSSEMVGYLKELGIDSTPLNLLLRDTPPVEGVDAQFKFPNTLVLYATTPMSDRAASLAHEYIHYVQQVDPEAETFYPYLQQLYKSDEWVYSRMEFYRRECTKYAEPCDFSNEIEAVACTEVPDRVLEISFRTWCYKQIPARSSIVTQ